MFVALLEITLIAFAIYTLLSFFWDTKAMDLIYGLIAFTAIYALVWAIHLPVLQKLLYYLANVAVIGMIVLFQPELRIALSKLSVKGKKYREVSEFDKFLNALTGSIYRMSDRKTGALVLIENQESLQEFAKKSILLQAEFSPELLETIFADNTPLHDGAVIISGTKVLSASTILPLADDSTQLSKSMGTRHRAALGISQVSDALVIVVSEETGRVSIARDGIMTRGIKMDRFKGIVSSIFNPPKPYHADKFSLITWIESWLNR